MLWVLLCEFLNVVVVVVVFSFLLSSFNLVVWLWKLVANEVGWSLFLVWFFFFFFFLILLCV